MFEFIFTEAPVHLLGLLVFLFIYWKKLNETFDASIVGILPWLDFIFLDHSVRNQNAYSFAGFIVITLLLGLYKYFDNNYKDFSWYISGKIGASGLLVLLILFI